MPPRSQHSETAAQPAATLQPAGAFSTWLDQTRRVRKLEVLGADVPCGECIGCCRGSLFIHIAPDETAALAHIPKALLFPAPGRPKGHVLMGFNQQGECPMLREHKCSIYEHRPQTCRDFDCRVLAATGIALPDDGPQAEIAARARSWRFDFPSERDRLESRAVQAAATFLLEHAEAFPEGALPSAPTQLAALALQVYPLFQARAGDDPSAEPAPSQATDPATLVRAIVSELRKRDPAGSRKPGRTTRRSTRS